MVRMMVLIIGFVCIVSCAKQVPTEIQATPVIEKPTIEDTGEFDEPTSIEPSPVKSEPARITPTSGLDPTVMQIKMGLGSDMVTSVNVTCDDFRTRKSIQNKTVTITNIPSNPSQCRLKFSPGGAVYILKKYEGYVLECTVINGNQATCK